MLTANRPAVGAYDLLTTGYDVTATRIREDKERTMAQEADKASRTTG